MVSGGHWTEVPYTYLLGTVFALLAQLARRFVDLLGKTGLQ